MVHKNSFLKFNLLSFNTLKKIDNTLQLYLNKKYHKLKLFSVKKYKIFFKKINKKVKSKID